MRIIKITFLCIAIVSITSCASSYKLIEPETIYYVSKSETENVKLEYKYNLLHKKYKKKELKKGVKLVAIKITNNSDRDLILGKDATLTYANGAPVFVMENDKVFISLKQSPASYLWYLLLNPLNLYTTDSNGEETSTTPIGLIIGPGLAGGNMIAASRANKKFKMEMMAYNINGTLLKKGEVYYGLIGIQSDSFDSLELKMTY